MSPAIPYVACVVGAVGLYLLLRPGERTQLRAMKAAGVLLGLGAFAWLLIEAGREIAVDETQRPEAMFVIFSLVAVASAVRMITHSRPVYSALYFVMVVLSSAGLFLLLQAEFMAFALVIVYAGAILITYMFVLMLAHQAPSADDPHAQPEYDRIPREPGMAATVGFILLALFTHMIFDGAKQVSPPLTIVEADQQTWAKLKLMPKAAQEAVERVAPGARLADNWDISVEDSVAWVPVIMPGEQHPVAIKLDPDSFPSNVQLVGLDLVAKFPASLELAGVILLLAMFGAVVLARKQIELGEDEVREAAGMRQLALHADEDHHHSDQRGAGR